MNLKRFYIVVFSILLVSIGYSFSYKETKEDANPLLKDSANDGGVGFKYIAQSLGWETNNQESTGALTRLEADPLRWLEELSILLPLEISAKIADTK